MFDSCNTIQHSPTQLYSLHVQESGFLDGMSKQTKTNQNGIIIPGTIARTSLMGPDPSTSFPSSPATSSIPFYSIYSSMINPSPQPFSCSSRHPHSHVYSLPISVPPTLRIIQDAPPFRVGIVNAGLGLTALDQQRRNVNLDFSGNVSVRNHGFPKFLVAHDSMTMGCLPQARKGRSSQI